MKALLAILMMISLNGYSQYRQKQLKQLNIIQFDSISVREVRRLTATEWIKLEAKSKLLPVLIQYQEYCYNDSSLVVFGKQGGEYLMHSHYDYMYVNGKMIKKDVWVHKQPTFEGFIEWLKK